MEQPKKFLLPAPNFGKKEIQKQQLHYLTPSGMTLLPRERQPPPMYGPKGATIPAKFLQPPEEKKPIEAAPPKRQFCEACEMELQSVEDLRRHRAQHERCPVDGCKFKGHPSVMDKHVIGIHNSGVFDKIQKLSTPEEIAAWRDERRKKYPTLANAKMRQLAEEQKQRRGERIQENKARFGRPEDRKRARTDNKKQERCNEDREIQPKKQRNNEKNNDKRRTDRRSNERGSKKLTEKNEKQINGFIEKKANEVKGKNVGCGGIKMFQGTKKLQGYKHEKMKKEKVNNSLLSLVAMYGSDDDDDESDSENDDTDNQMNKTETGMVNDDLKQNNNEKCNITEVDNTTEEPKTSTSETKMLNQTNSESLLIENCDSKQQSLLDNNKTFEEKTSEIQTDIGAIEENIKELNPSKSLNESSDEGPEEAPIQRTTTIESTQSEKPTTSAAALTEIAAEPESIEAKRLRILESRKQIQDKRKSAFNLRKRKLRKQNTMLEKLLEPEIRHERNVLLQCVRYVCENNFFGIGSEISSKEETESQT